MGKLKRFYDGLYSRFMLCHRWEYSTDGWETRDEAYYWLVPTICPVRYWVQLVRFYTVLVLYPFFWPYYRYRSWRFSRIIRKVVSETLADLPDDYFGVAWEQADYEFARIYKVKADDR